MVIGSLRNPRVGFTGSLAPLHRRRSGGFSLVEILVASGVLLLVLTLVLSIVSQTSSVWRSSAQKISAFQSARAGFERLTRQLSQATLNTYWEYDDVNNPQKYVRQSELHFRSGPNLLDTPSHAVFFQAPASRTDNPSAYGGLERLLNGCGFFIDYVEDDIPAPLTDKVESRKRFRLMQWMQNTEELNVYKGNSDPQAWYQNARAEAIPVADNIIALVIWPKLPDTETPPVGWEDSYEYDSRQGSLNNQPITMNQLPPIVQVAMVAIDARSAERLGPSLESEIRSATQGLFERLDSSDPRESMQKDLTELENRLREKNIEYRIFESAVPIREAKWSKE